MEEYLTILTESNAEYDEKRSRFLAVLIPCQTEEQVAEKLSSLRSKYWDAKHNVYAYILKNGASRFSDDGEPHGTAGKPVLDVLSGSGLTDVLLVVTRYFGGVLLGTGGLVRAYSTSARGAIEAAQKVKMCPGTEFSVNCEYSDHQRLVRLIQDYNGNITDTQFTSEICVKYVLALKDIELFREALRETFSDRLQMIEGESGYSPVNL